MLSQFFYGSYLLAVANVICHLDDLLKIHVCQGDRWDLLWLRVTMVWYGILEFNVPLDTV